MSDHFCPFTLGELLALYAVAQTRANPTLAAKVLGHSRLHDVAAPAAPVVPAPERLAGESLAEWARRVQDSDEKEPAA